MALSLGLFLGALIVIGLLVGLHRALRLPTEAVDVAILLYVTILAATVVIAAMWR